MRQIKISGQNHFKVLAELRAFHIEYVNGNFQYLHDKLSKVREQFLEIPTYWYLFALTAKNLRQYNQASTYFETALQLDPDNTNILRDTSIFYREIGLIDLALKHAERLIFLRPNTVTGYLNLGLIFLKMHNIDRAEQCFFKARDISPENERVINCLAKLHIERTEFQQAIDILKKNLETNDNLESRLNLALAYRLNNELLLATSLIDTVSQSQIKSLNPASQNQFIFNRSLIRLSAGECTKGWIDYKKRFEAPDFTSAYRKYERERLNYIRDGYKKIVLIWPEQGISDTLMFSCLLREFQEESRSKLILLIDLRLKSLFQRSFPNIEILEDKKDAHQQLNFDYHLPLGDIAPLLSFDLGKKSIAQPYLKPKEDLIAHWKSKLSPQKKLCVGIAWESGIKNLKRDLNHTSLLDWRRLIENKNLMVINLQYDTDINAMSIAERTLYQELYHPNFDLKNDFENLVALMCNLDCVITPGSSVMSLAAACGIPTYSYCTHVTDRALGDINGNGVYSVAWFRRNKVYLFDRYEKEKMVDKIISEVEMKFETNKATLSSNH